MKESTKKAFDNMRNQFGFMPFTIEEINGISESTFEKWYEEMGIKKVIIKREYTLEETIEFLNSCSGEDCYCGHWHFIVEDGKIYDTEDGYQFQF